MAFADDHYGYSEDEWWAMSREERDTIHRDHGETNYNDFADDSDGTYANDDIDQALAGVPLIGDGSARRQDEARQRAREDRQESYWQRLERLMPTVDDLAVDYAQEDWIEGPGESALAGAEASADSVLAEQQAMQQLEQIYRSGGLTSADRARMQLGEAEMGRAMRSQREADMSALQARGMGGGGAQVASMLGAQQGGASMLAQREQEMQVAAEQRAMQALAGAGSMAQRRRGASFNEEATRGRALDEFNRWNTEEARGYEQRTTATENRSRESVADARRDVQGMRERQTAGITGDYPTNVAASQDAADRRDEDNDDYLALIGAAAGAA